MSNQKKPRKTRSDKNKKRKHSWMNLDRLATIEELPEYDPDLDYYKEFFKLFLQNENLL